VSTQADTGHVSITARRYQNTGRSRAGRAGRTRLATIARRAPEVSKQGTSEPTIDMETRKEHVEQIHAHIRSDSYEVDAEAIAEAIIRRLIEGRSLGLEQPRGEQT
jgi:anti-sigma28 factor (negative regulator of flagellin synthesis)